MEHKHKYDAQGKQLCCTPQEEKINTDAKMLLEKHLPLRKVSRL